MNDHERFFFDLNGYLVLDDVLTPEELEACNNAIDHEKQRIEVRSAESSLSRGSKPLHGDHGRGDLGGMLTWPKPWCQSFRDLLAHPRITPYLGELLGEGYRLDHLYGIIMTKGAEGHVLHGGAISDNRTNLYKFQDSKMWCGLTVVTWVLTDQNEGDGGFACIPGSHKSNYPIPEDVARLESDTGMVKQIEARAGSAIIFTEALGHGTLPWRSNHERRSILYKYSPGVMSYSQKYLPDGVEELLQEFTPEQRSLLEPPYAQGRPMSSDVY